MARREARNFLVLGWKQIIFVLKNSRNQQSRYSRNNITISRCLSLRLNKRTKRTNFPCSCVLTSTASPPLSSSRPVHSHLWCTLTRLRPCRTHTHKFSCSLRALCQALDGSWRLAIGWLRASESFGVVSDLGAWGDLWEGAAPAHLRTRI